jgi:uncharacterized Zn finger protein (UPF0148 family)
MAHPIDSAFRILKATIGGEVTCPVCGEKTQYSWKDTQSSPASTVYGCDHDEVENEITNNFYRQLDARNEAGKDMPWDYGLE